MMWTLNQKEDAFVEKNHKVEARRKQTERDTKNKMGRPGQKNLRTERREKRRIEMNGRK